MKSATGTILRRRIDPVDRRCYAFFHPAPGLASPLIFVEVPLTESSRTRSRRWLAADRQPPPPRCPIERAARAVFYSISHTQRGLGEFLCSAAS